MASKPEIEHGIDDKDTWWYRCPVCHDPLDYKQEICSWCYEVIEWDEDGEQEAQQDYERSVEYAQYCERYEPTYNPEDGSM